MPEGFPQPHKNWIVTNAVSAARADLFMAVTEPNLPRQLAYTVDDLVASITL
jgi:hypothetical protein